MPLVGSDGDTPPIGGTWAYNELVTFGFKPEKPVMPGHFNVQDYGAVPDWDGVTGTDNLAAFNACLAAMGADGNKTNKMVADGAYYLSDTLVIAQTVLIEGSGKQDPRAGASGARSSAGTMLVFPTNVTGVWIRETLGTGFGEQSVLRNLTIFCKDDRGVPIFPDTCGIPPNGKTGFGVLCHAVVTLDHVHIQNFAETGCFIQAGAESEGNADGVSIRDCTFAENGAHGIHIQGSDAQAGIVDNCYSICNWGWGFFDESLTGNTWISCLGQGNLGEPGGYSVDGRNHDYKSGSVATPTTAAVFFGCYTEASVNEFVPNSGAIGGILGQKLLGSNGFTLGPDGLVRDAPLRYLNQGPYPGTAAGCDTYFGAGASLPFTSMQWTTFGVSPAPYMGLRYNPVSAISQGWFTWDISPGSHTDFLAFPAGFQGGFRTNDHAPWALNGLLLGNGREEPTAVVRSLHLADISPPIEYPHGLFRTYEVGDIVWNTAPLPSADIGWVCLTAGTQGTLNGGLTTGDIAITTDQLTVSDDEGIYVGCYLTIAGVTGPNKVTDLVGLVATIDPASDATVVGAAVSYSAPVITTFGPITPRTIEIEVTGDETTTSATFADLLSMTIDVQTGALDILASASGSSTAGAAFFRITVDGTPLANGGSVFSDTDSMSLVKVARGLAPGSHTVALQWAVEVDTVTSASILASSAPNYQHATLLVKPTTV